MQIALVILGFVNLVLIFMLVKNQSKKTEESSALLIKQDLDNLSENITKLKDGLGQQINERLDKNNELMQKSVLTQFKESSKLVADVTERLTKLDETNKRVVDVADELKTLQNVLQNPKQRGVLG